MKIFLDLKVYLEDWQCHVWCQQAVHWQSHATCGQNSERHNFGRRTFRIVTSQSGRHHLSYNKLDSAAWKCYQVWSQLLFGFLMIWNLAFSCFQIALWRYIRYKNNIFKSSKNISQIANSKVSLSFRAWIPVAFGISSRVPYWFLSHILIQ